MMKSTALNNNFTPLISIIIPIYNSEKYLDQCIKSVIRQKYKNLEILCIDDCSTDKSLKILEKYAKKDQRIKIFQNNQNLGAGYSRNIGIKNSLGDYCLFLDSDDWLEKNSLNILINSVNKNKTVDFIQYGMSHKHPYLNLTLSKSIFPDEFINKQISLSQNTEVLSFIEFKINKFVNTKFLKINNITFNNNKTLEDVDFTIDLIKNATNITLINNRIYNYRLFVKNSVSSKIPNFVDYNIKFLENAKSSIIKFDNNFQAKILNNLYKLFLLNVIDSYFNKKINYDEMVNLININIDYNILFLNSNKYYINLYNSIQNLSEKEFNNKYYLKFLIKNKFYFLYLLYKNIKKCVICNWNIL